MQNEELKQEEVDYKTLLIEMEDSMSDSISNLEKVINNSSDLLDIVSNSDKKENFADFIEEMTTQVENYKKQHETLTSRKNYLHEVNDMINKNEKVSQTIGKFCKAIGLFR